jgi:hypothetical protein
MLASELAISSSGFIIVCDLFLLLFGEIPVLVGLFQFQDGILVSCGFVSMKGHSTGVDYRRLVSGSWSVHAKAQIR